MPYILELLPTTADASSFYSTQTRSTDNAGIDLFVPELTTFEPGEKKLVSMRVKARMTDVLNNQVHYWMPPRSSISKTGLLLLNSIGVIDKTYRGELMAFLWNTTANVVSVQKGDRLVQIVAPDMGDVIEVRVVESLDATARGENGFGSTGK